MKRITLDLTHIETVKALHIYLQYMLDLPHYYGRNLDALHDCLTEIAEDTQIALHAQGCGGELKAYMPRLLRVLEDAAQENRRLHISLA